MPDSHHDEYPDLRPEQAREVRRLLADARHSEPIPSDVAARLDRVLAELATQGVDATHADEGASVVALASRRRRRVISVLVAAAAVVAVGVGMDQLVQAGGGGSSSSMSAADRPEVASGSAGSGSGARQRHPQPHSYLKDQKSDSVAAAPQMAVSDVVRIRSDHFSADVGRARRLTRHPVQVDGELDKRAARDCTPGDWGSGTFVPVRYDGHRGVLVFRRANGDSQVADLFSCGSSDVLRSITLPAR